MLTGQLTYGQAESYDSNLSDDLILSPRANSLSGTISTSAENADAFYYNPAGIGGLYNNDTRSVIRRFDFLSISGAINENTNALSDEMVAAGGSSDSVAAASVIDAAAGKRQYGRVSIFPNFVIGRFFLGALYDSQIAAVPLGDQTDTVNLNYRTVSGPAFGFSASTSNDSFYLGFSGAQLSRTDVKGEFQFLDMINSETREETLAEYKNNFVGTNKNAGIIWRISPKAGVPTIAISARDIGGTEYASDDPSIASKTVKENTSLGFSVTPKIGKIGYYHFAFEAKRLTDKDVSTSRKLSIGSELRFGSYQGQKSALTISAGYNASGPSYGLGINLGILQASLSSEAVDIVEDNTDVIERRNSIQFTVNLAD